MFEMCEMNNCGSLLKQISTFHSLSAFGVATILLRKERKYKVGLNPIYCFILFLSTCMYFHVTEVEDRVIKTRCAYCMCFKTKRTQKKTNECNAFWSGTQLSILLVLAQSEN